MTKETFKRILKKSGLSQEDFAKSIGLAQSTISCILSGYRNLTLQTCMIVEMKYPGLVKKQRVIEDEDVEDAD